MSLIDRYLVLVFARVFAICFCSFVGMYLVADFVDHLNELLEYAQTEGGLPAVLLAYYGPQLPWFFDLFSRIVGLIAAVFAVTWLQRNNEMAALMAAGVSRWRIVKPLVVSFMVVTVLAALNRECVIPRLRSRLSHNAQNWLGDREMPLRPRYDHATDIFFDGQATIARHRCITLPRLRLPPTCSSLGEQIVAETARQLPIQDGRPAGYLLDNVQEPEDLSGKASVTVKDEPLIFCPADTSWLEPGQVFVVSNIPFSHLEGGNSWRQFASTWDLIAGLRNPSLDYGADVSVTIHSRLLQPLLDTILLFLGLPLVLARESRNVFVSVGLCLLMVAVFLGVSLAFQALGMNYLIQPALAAWSPLMVFVPVALVMSEPLRR